MGMERSAENIAMKRTTENNLNYTQPTPQIHEASSQVNDPSQNSQETSRQVHDIKSVNRYRNSFRIAPVNLEKPVTQPEKPISSRTIEIEVKQPKLYRDLDQLENIFDKFEIMCHEKATSRFTSPEVKLETILQSKIYCIIL